MCLHTNMCAWIQWRWLASTCGLNEKGPRSGWDKQVRKFNPTLPTPVVIGRVWKGQVCQDSRILGVLSGKTDLRSCLFRPNICPGFLHRYWLSPASVHSAPVSLDGGTGECDYPWLYSGVRSGVTCMDLLDCFRRTKKMCSLCLWGENRACHEGLERPV